MKRTRAAVAKEHEEFQRALAASAIEALDRRLEKDDDLDTKHQEPEDIDIDEDIKVREDEEEDIQLHVRRDVIEEEKSKPVYLQRRHIVASKPFTHYNSIQTNPKQLRNGHINEVKDSKKVPPIDIRFNFDEEYLNAGMSIREFLGTIAESENVMNIFAQEMEAEAVWCVHANETDKSSPYFNKTMKYGGWSLMLAAEYVFEDTSGKSFKQILEDKIKEELTKLPQDAENIGEYTDAVCLLLNKIYARGLTSEFIQLRTTYAKNISYDFHAVFRTSLAWGRAFPTTEDSELAKVRYLTKGFLKPPATSQKILTEKAARRQENALLRPVPIHEIEFKRDLKRLISHLFPNGYFDEAGEYEHPVLKNSFDCASLLILIQLLCGSRSRGVIGTNIYSKVSGLSGDEYKMLKDNKSDKKELKSLYGASDYCVVVERITKERESEIRSIQATIDKEKLVIPGEAPVVVHRMIGKPILTPLIDSAYLMDRKVGETVKRDFPSGENMVDWFLYIVHIARSYLYEHDDKKHRWALKNNIYNYIDDFAYKGTGKHSPKWTARMNEVLKATFKCIPKTITSNYVGTHMLRRIYVNRCFHYFAKPGVKETGFANKLLGHLNFSVSLYYTSLNFIPIVGTKPGLDTEEYLLQQVAELNYAFDDWDYEKIVLVDVWGVEVRVPRLPPVLDVSEWSDERRVLRALEALDILRDFYIRFSWNTLKSLRVNVSQTNRELLISDERFFEARERNDELINAASKETVEFTLDSGATVEVEKLSFISQVPLEVHLERAEEAAVDLEENGVPVTLANLRRLGVNTNSKRYRDAIRERLDM